MKLPSTKAIMFNGAAVLVMGTAVVTQIKSFFATEVIPSCMAYYENAVGLGLERGGQLITAVDIQAGAGGADHGVLENLQTVRIGDGPAAAALAVALKKGSAHPNHARDLKGGISFPWRPRALPVAAPSLCLSYHVKLPDGFEFASGLGTLPGVSIAPQDSTTDETIAVHFGWNHDGRAGMRFAARTAKDLRRESVMSERTMPRGRWFRVDQEIQLNAAGSANGMMRFWIDGDLAATQGEMAIRSSDAVKFDGVLVDVHFGQFAVGADGRAGRDETILLSPFELRWRK